MGWKEGRKEERREGGKEEGREADREGRRVGRRGNTHKEKQREGGREEGREGRGEGVPVIFEDALEERVEGGEGGCDNLIEGPPSVLGLEEGRGGQRLFGWNMKGEGGREGGGEGGRGRYLVLVFLG